MHFLFSSSVIPLKSVQIFCRESRTILENFAEITRFGPIALKSKEKKEEEKGRKKEEREGRKRPGRIARARKNGRFDLFFVSNVRAIARS